MWKEFKATSYSVAAAIAALISVLCLINNHEPRQEVILGFILSGVWAILAKLEVK